MPNLQVHILSPSILFILLAWLSLPCTSDTCVSSQYTQLIDSQIQRLKWLDLTHHDFINATEEAFMDDTMCSRTEHDHMASLNHRTMCPWEIVEDYDENRYPVRLNVARCKCSTCSTNHVCHPVLYSIPVLVKQCEDGVMHWIRKQKLISVACTCSMRRIRYVLQKRTGAKSSNLWNVIHFRRRLYTL